MDDKERQSAFLSALATEHFVLVAAMNPCPHGCTHRRTHGRAGAAL